MKRLRIAIISGLHTSLPPKSYGGIERVLLNVSEALHARGHEVTIFGSDETQTACRSIPYGPVVGVQTLPSWKYITRLWKLLHRHAHEFDVVHNFFRAAFLGPLLPRRIPKLISYACPINPRVISSTDFLAGDSIHYAVCAQHMLNSLSPSIPREKWHVIYNPIDLKPYQFRAKPQTTNPYLVFLSRQMMAKGPHLAVEVARRAGKRLIIAGNVQECDKPFFNTKVLPFVDGEQVKYLGPIGDVQKNELLGNAEAMLFPITWEEPFGLVVGESMATGTPVLTMKRGSMPEIIQHGKNGFLCDSVDDMVEKVGQIHTLDRQASRDSVVDRFAPEIIATEYEKLYYKMIRGN